MLLYKWHPLWYSYVSMWCVPLSVKGGEHGDRTNCSTPRSPCLIQHFFWQQTELGVANCHVLPLTILCSLYISIQIKTMASTSSVSQVSVWTWSWDNLPRSSFLLHQMRASVCLSLVSFTFSHLLLTFIIQIRMLSTKTDGRRDGWCRSPCSPCASPWATKWQPIVSEGLYAS